MLKKHIGVIAGMLVMSFSTSAWAQYPKTASDWWPCIQRYVPELSAGVFWTGELLSENVWRNRPDVIELADAVTARDLSLEHAVARVEEFLNKQTGDKAEVASMLVGAMTVAANVRRDQVLEGIKRFSKRQQMMLERMQEQTGKIESIERDDSSTTVLEELRARQKWDIRVFEEREKLSAVLCEQPVLLEQRLFSLGRSIAAYLEAAAGG